MQTQDASAVVNKEKEFSHMLCKASCLCHHVHMQRHFKGSEGEDSDLLYSTGQLTIFMHTYVTVQSKTIFRC